jgi:hypothetical protein
MIQSLTPCCGPEEPSLRVIPHGALTYIALIPTIKEEVITVQKTNVGMGHIRRRLRLLKEFYGSRIDWWFRRILSSVVR